jgi:hypothetical protein
VVIKGNLQIDGTTTTINSTTVSVDDLNLTLADGAANAAAANGAGITISGAGATFNYASSGDKWQANKSIETSSQLISTVATATAPLVIASTTRVANLNVATAGTADTFTTARNINGVAFNGSADITVADATKLPLTGGTITTSTTLPDIAGASLTPLTIVNDTSAGKQALRFSHHRETAGTTSDGTYTQITRAIGVTDYSSNTNSFIRLRNSTSALHDARKLPITFGDGSSDRVGMDYFGRLHVGVPVAGTMPTNTLNILNGTPTIGFIDGLELGATSKYSQINADNGDLVFSADILNQQASSTISFNIDGANVATLSAGGALNVVGTLSATAFSGPLTGNASTATTLQTARNINGTSFNGSADITTANWGTSRTITIGATGKSVNGSGNISWTLDELQAEYRQPTNSARNNLGDPTVREMALFHGQFNNKFRFIPATTQEESTNGTTWTASTRASANQLADIMLGEGQTGGFAAIPSGTVGTFGGYRLTWDVVGQTGYVFLNNLYFYNSASGNNITVLIEAFHNTTGWQVVTGPHTATGK